MKKKTDIFDIILNIVVFITIIILVCCIGFTLLCMISYACNGMGHEYYITGTVTDKGIKKSGVSDKYLVYVINENDEPKVMEITDNILGLKFNSSDIYATILVGSEYKFKVKGFRNTIFSFYPNIYSLELLEGE